MSTTAKISGGGHCVEIAITVDGAWYAYCVTAGCDFDTHLSRLHPHVVGQAQRHITQACSNRRRVIQTLSGYPSEVHMRGHDVVIVTGDHPVVSVRGLLPVGVQAQLHPTMYDNRLAWCSCGGAQAFTDSDPVRNAARAAAWTENHCNHSTNSTRDYKWTRMRGWVPKAAASRCAPTTTTRSSAVPTLEPILSRRAIVRTRIAELEGELAYLASLPEEPRVEGDETGEANVIWFEKTFSTPTVYTYAAVRAGDGLWYTSGPRAPKGYSWDRLIEWILADEPEAPKIWHAYDWDPLV